MKILNNIIFLMEEKRISQKKLTDYLDVSKNVFTEWKSQRSKSYMKYLPQIADFLEVPIDALLDRENVASINGNYNAVNNSTVTIGDTSKTLSEQEQEILRIYNTLSTKEKAELFLKICEYEKKEEK